MSDSSLRITFRDLASRSSIVSRTVLGRHIAQLQQAGWLSLDAGTGRSPNTYHLVRPSHHTERFIRVPGSLVAAQLLPPAAKVLYAALLAHCTSGAKALVTRRLDLVATVGVGSDNIVRDLLHRLVEAGWVRIDSNAKTGLIAYEPLDPHRRLREAERDRARQLIDDQTYIGEVLMQLMLTALVADTEFIDNAWPDFPINPYTGHRMEFDRWYKGAGVAFEFNGPQHDSPTRAFPDPAEANQQRGRDLMKPTLAAENGIKLIVLKPHELTFEQLAAKIGNALPLRTLRREDPLVAYLSKMSRNYVRRVAEDQF